MKLRTNFIDKQRFEKKAAHLKDIDFTLFADEIPKSQDDVSRINILVLQEPNEYFGLHDWAIKNSKLFNAILTWDDYVINNCSNALFLPFGGTWLEKEQYTATHTKQFELAHLRGTLLKTYGQLIRHEVYDRRKEITNIPLKFYDTYGNRNDIDDARKGKEFVFGGSMFGVAIENTSHNGYFTEKLLDCFLMKTIPLYWGCSSTFQHFDERGIIRFENTDDLIMKANALTSEMYTVAFDVIEKNYTLALQYIDYEQNIINVLESLFNQNGLLK